MCVCVCVSGGVRVRIKKRFDIVKNTFAARIYVYTYRSFRDVMVIVLRNGFGRTSSNPRRGDSFSHCTNTVVKGMNSIILLPTRGK